MGGKFKSTSLNGSFRPKDFSVGRLVVRKDGKSSATEHLVYKTVSGAYYAVHQQQ